MTSCYLCHSTSHHVRPGSVRDNAGLKVLECNDCGLVFLSSFSHVQPSHYAGSGMHGDKLIPIEDWLRESEVDDERRFGGLRQMLAGKTVLDFGCGAGGFLLKARKVSAAVEGIEPELRLQPHFKQSGLKAHTHIDALETSGASRFDIITAFHVVEHLPDPRATLARLARLLASGGELVIEVPNSEDALLTLYACEAFTHFTYWSQHLFLFNTRTLSDLVCQAGLKLRWIKQVQRYPLSNHLYWLSQGKPGGHQKWAFIDSPALDEAYGAQLAVMERCDTLLAGVGLD